MFYFTACFFIYLLTMGTIKTFGILYAELLHTYQGGSGNTASIGSTCNFIQSFLGIGYGLTFVPCTTLLNFYFEKNRALANGIVVSGSGLGNFIFPFLYRFLLDNYGLHGTMIILSGLMLNCCVASALYRQPIELFRTKSSRKLLDKEDSPAADTQSSTICQNCTKFFISIFKFRWSLFRSMSFLAVTVSFAIAIVGYGANFYILPVYIESLHFTKDDVSVTLCIIGVLEVISRISFGWFVDRKLVSAKVIFVFSMFISGLSTLSLPHVKHVYVLYVYAGIVGTFPGSLYTLMPVIIIDTVGLGSLPSALGLMTLFNSLVAVVGIPCLGWLQDLTGSWDASFYYMTSLFLASSITVLLVHIFKKKDKTTNKDFETPDEIIDTHFNSDDNSNEAVKVV
ncbi:hypothetical protein FSP39_005346 [Pinctada imbricata]|uniref:Major facilitator superfamily (MFS) profile domain-containing protein n=1 Tax=Pinctada imbricata TaxID=66713 RepID=A0AA88Y285_PINIB|nr:hypothetical protein FSP39_005346 [Pinctada imbricata]